MRTHALRRMLLAALVGAQVLLAASPVHAGAFAVSPVRLELGGRERSGAITVRNDDQVTLSFQVRAMAWRIDETGQDVYQDAPELVYFPRVVTIAPGREAVIRVGLRQPLVASEQTFRLFIEELPPPAAAAADDVPQVRFLVRFGAPVFVKPTQAVHRLDVQGTRLDAGLARWQLDNLGNRHERFETLALRGFDAQGLEVFSHLPGDRYLLAGQTRRFSAEVPAPLCARISRMHLEIKTDRSDLKREIELGPTPCG